MHKNLKLLAIFNFLTDFDLIAPIAIIYFARVSGSYALGMSVFSIIYLSSALFEVPTGIFSDMIGRKKTYICGSVATLLSAVILASGNSYIFLVMAGIFAGLGRAFFSGNDKAFLYDTLAEMGKQNSFHTYLGKLSSVFQIALALSAVFSGVIAEWSFHILLWIGVLPKLLMVIVSMLFKEPHHFKKESTNVFSHLKASLVQFKRNYKLRLLTITTALRFGLGESTYLFRASFYIMLWPLWAIGITSTISNIGAAFSYYFSGKLIDTFKPYKILVFEILSNRALNLIALLIPSVVSPAIMSLTSITYGVGEVARTTLLQKEFTDEQRATMGSVSSFLSSIAFALCSFLLGSLADKTGPIQTLIVVNIIYFFPLFLYREIFKKNLS